MHAVALQVRGRCTVGLTHVRSMHFRYMVAARGSLGHPSVAVIHASEMTGKDEAVSAEAV
ncbi:hypothetical protein A2J03_26790 [Rhodococcus sp. EPR-157]|jgi:hypothetical protein|nr:hypothetical protein A2J03_26790 [Rhodococcus sp. EPR-157]